MTTQILPDYSTLCKATADLMIDYLHSKKNAFVCLASGHTPIGVFQQLAQAVSKKELDVSKCTFLILDEWIGIEPEDAGSCLSMLTKDFFAPLHIHSSQIKSFDVTARDLQKECNRINDLIEKNGWLDIMLVGVGTNGHIGMNEPGTSFDSYSHVSELAEETKTVGQKYFEKSTKLSQGITLGLKHLREAKLPIVMASGEKKAAILAKAFQSKPSIQIPVSIVQLIAQGYLMLDSAAAIDIPK
jgi:glucosamine-6-phosphate isomerase